MKSKLLRAMLVTALVTSLITGCGKKEDDAVKENTVYGQVTAISDGEITIDVAEMGRSGQEGEVGEPNNKPNEGETNNETVNNEQRKSNLTGESKTYSFAKNITFSEEQMGGGKPDMNVGGRQPGEIATDSEGQTIEMPTDSEGNQITKNAEDSGNQPPEMPSGDSNNQPPKMPSEDSNNQPPEMPSGEGNNQSGDMKNFERETKTINLSDINVGDMVKITLDDSGKATNISVVSMGEMNPMQNENGNEQQETTTEITNTLNDDKTKKSDILV